MSDDCCADDAPTRAEPGRSATMPPVWRIREFQLSAAVGLLVLAGYLTQWWFSPTVAISLVIRLPIGPSGATSAACGWSLEKTTLVTSSTSALKRSLSSMSWFLAS